MYTVIMRGKCVGLYDVFVDANGEGGKEICLYGKLRCFLELENKYVSRGMQLFW